MTHEDIKFRLPMGEPLRERRWLRDPSSAPTCCSEARAASDEPAAASGDTVRAQRRALPTWGAGCATEPAGEGAGTVAESGGAGMEATEENGAWPGPGPAVTAAPAARAPAAAAAAAAAAAEAAWCCTGSEGCCRAGETPADGVAQRIGASGLDGDAPRGNAFISIAGEDDVNGTSVAGGIARGIGTGTCATRGMEWLRLGAPIPGGAAVANCSAMAMEACLNREASLRGPAAIEA